MNQPFFTCGDLISLSSHHPDLLLKSPYLARSVGNIKRFSTVELNKPPTIIDAIGPSISLPGSPLPTINGSNPNPVTIAVIKMDGNLSDAPFAAVAKFHSKFSCLTKYW